ncbi:MAG: signal peptidase I [Deltaproteobacteria bacterium]|nr:signal peptidase I [Deltaproteobacteria bacterium]
MASVATAVALRTWVIGSAVVASESMRPTLEVGDHLWVDRTAYGMRWPWSTAPAQLPQRGDVVVFRYPFDDGSTYVGRRLIKRVVGLPGDRLRLRDNRWELNGRPVDRRVVAEREPCAAEQGVLCERAVEVLDGQAFHTWRRVPEFVGQRHPDDGSPINDRSWPPGIFNPTRVKPAARRFSPPQNGDYPDFVLPPGVVLLVGDHRDGSQDGRHFGLVEVGAIEGRARLVWASRAPGEWLPRWDRLGLGMADADR